MFFVCSSIHVIAQTDSLFSITGNLSQVKKGTVFLTVYGGDSPKKDSVAIVNGKFSFVGAVSKPSVAVLSIKDQ